MSDDIRVICESTSERMLNAKKNFELIKPLLDKGYIYSNACFEVGLVSNMTGGWRRYAWYKELIKYGESQGYPYRLYSGKGGVRK